MELFRGLAEQGRCAVVVVTHATKSLRLCDRLVVMGRGGHLCFQGPPEEALDFFGADDFDEVYVALERRAPEEWRAAFEAPTAAAGAAMAGHDALPASPRHRTWGGRPARDAAVSPPRRRVSGAVAARVLTGRYLRLLVRDRRNLALLLGQAPLIGAGVAFPVRGRRVRLRARACGSGHRAPVPARRQRDLAGGHRRVAGDRHGAQRHRAGARHRGGRGRLPDLQGRRPAGR